MWAAHYQGSSFWERSGWRKRVFCALWKVFEPFRPRSLAWPPWHGDSAQTLGKGHAGTAGHSYRRLVLDVFSAFPRAMLVCSTALRS